MLDKGGEAGRWRGDEKLAAEVVGCTGDMDVDVAAIGCNARGWPASDTSLALPMELMRERPPPAAEAAEGLPTNSGDPMSAAALALPAAALAASLVSIRPFQRACFASHFSRSASGHASRPLGRGPLALPVPPDAEGSGLGAGLVLVRPVSSSSLAASSVERLEFRLLLPPC